MTGTTDIPSTLQREGFGSRKMELACIIEGRMGEEGEATSSVTLVKTATSTVVVDSGAKHVRNELIRYMRENEAKVDKVNVLVTTTATPLHTGNDDLFVHCLQHVKESDWGEVPVRSNRKVAITTPYHWIDRYLKILQLPFPGSGSLVLLAHFPRKEELLEASSVELAGKIVGICGPAVPSEDSPEVRAALEKARTMERPGGDITDLEGLMAYCDRIVPGYGKMFEVR